MTPHFGPLYNVAFFCAVNFCASIIIPLVQLRAVATNMEFRRPICQLPPSWESYIDYISACTCNSIRCVCLFLKFGAYLFQDVDDEFENTDSELISVGMILPSTSNSRAILVLPSSADYRETPFHYFTGSFKENSCHAGCVSEHRHSAATL